VEYNKDLMKQLLYCEYIRNGEMGEICSIDIGRKFAQYLSWKTRKTFVYKRTI
jgi:hypothetical protein